MEKCVIDEGHPQFAGMYAGAASDPKARQIAEGADLVLDLGGVNNLCDTGHQGPLQKVL